MFVAKSYFTRVKKVIISWEVSLWRQILYKIPKGLNSLGVFTPDEIRRMNLKLLIRAQPWKGWISGIKPGNSTPIGVGRYPLDYCFFFHRISSGANNTVFNPIRDWYVAAFFIILGWWNPILLIADFKTKTCLFNHVPKYPKVGLTYLFN